MKKTTKLLAFTLFLCAISLSSCKKEKDIWAPAPTIPKVTSFAITFEVDGGSAVAPINVENGKTATKPTDPTKAGYTFDGWYNEATFATPFNFTLQTITKATTLYAKWKVAGFTISFSDPLLNATMPANITTAVIKAGDIDEPTKAGYSFVGWSETSDVYGATITYPYTLNANKTLYPQWVSAINPTNINDAGSTIIINAVNTLATELVIIPEKIGGKAVGEITGDGTVNNSIKKVILPNTLNTIGNIAFKFCTYLASINIPNSVTSIGMFAFSNCPTLTNITIPESVTSIGVAVFFNCNKLANVVISAKITNLSGNFFSDCPSLTSITIPDSVINIDDSAFSNCTKLTTVFMPSNLQSIKNRAFRSCTSLTNIRIPLSVNTIQAEAFRNCTNLMDVVFDSNTPPTILGNNIFTATNAILEIKVPIGSVPAYQAAFSGKIDSPSRIIEL